MMSPIQEAEPMIKWRRQSLVAYGQPLCETIAECPTPRGSEVLLRVECCGVCHSDLHVQDGYFALGGDKQLDITKDRALPFTLGHEIAGVIEAVGEQAGDAVIGRRVAVYPWIGCGSCPACNAGNENMCSANHHLGVTADGGYASHVLVPHPRYLLDYAPLAPAFAGPLMCSGLTAYAGAQAHRRSCRTWSGAAGRAWRGRHDGFGAGPSAVCRAADRSRHRCRKRRAALAAGAAQAFDPSDPRKRAGPS
jgi:D-arabinose 1-dehydrogenase-like Zn-dependent alcohol dehydrogenase